MNFTVDLILVAVILIYFIMGWHRGFIKTAMSLVSFILAGFGAYLFHGIPSNLLYSNVFLPKISGMIENAISSLSQGLTLDRLLAEKPAFFTDIVEKYSDMEKTEAFLQSGAEKTLTELCDFLAEPIARTVSNVLGFILVFVILMVALKIVTFIVDKIFKLPVLRGANTLLGIVLGALMGFLMAWLIASVVGGSVAALHTAFPDAISETLVEDSVVLKFFYHFNPLTFIK